MKDKFIFVTNNNLPNYQMIYKVWDFIPLGDKGEAVVLIGGKKEERFRVGKDCRFLTTWEILGLIKRGIEVVNAERTAYKKKWKKDLRKEDIRMKELKNYLEAIGFELGSEEEDHIEFVNESLKQAIRICTDGTVSIDINYHDDYSSITMTISLLEFIIDAFQERVRR